MEHGNDDERSTRLHPLHHPHDRFPDGHGARLRLRARELFRRPFAAMREQSLREKAAYNARVAGDNVHHFICLGTVLGGEWIADCAARYARIAWHEAQIALGPNA